MAKPTFAELMAYGAGAWQKAKERKDKDEALEIASALSELKEVTATPIPEQNNGGYNVDLPTANFGVDDQVELSLALKQIGLSEKGIAEGNKEQTLLNEIRGLESRPQRIDALNKRSVAPVGFNGGTAFNKFDTANPILAESNAVTQLARYRESKAVDQELRNSSLQTILEDPEIDPLTAATVANKGSTFKPQRVKVRRADGKDVYMDATPLIGGGYSYALANDKKGNPLIVPPSPSSTSPIEKDAELFERVLDMDKKAATRLSLSLRQHLKTAKPDEAWSKLVSEISKMQFNRYAKDPKRLYEKAAEIWQVKFPGREIPNRDVLEATLLPEEKADQEINAEAPLQEDVRQRAQEEGFEIIGEWVEGKGFLARDEQGRKGYFY